MRNVSVNLSEKNGKEFESLGTCWQIIMWKYILMNHYSSGNQRMIKMVSII
jgi:hypothetical protein